MLLISAAGVQGLMTRHATIAKPSDEMMRASVKSELLESCEERWRATRLDHFSFQPAVIGFQQRYFICNRTWQPGGPVLFYFGNEANVLLYLNNTGLMHESAHDLNAALVFAEHRYYGLSKPFDKDLRKHMAYLTAPQAMADYAGLIQELKASSSPFHDSAFIGFGGSYGGMLGSWFRMKYPHLINGVIAGSAPIWTFMGEEPEVDAAFFSKGVTHDASPSGGAVSGCTQAVRSGWQAIEALAASSEGLKNLQQVLKICPSSPLKTIDDAMALRSWLAASWDMMAMGNFPYQSPYILNGAGTLPAYPVRVACDKLMDQVAVSNSTEALLEGVREAALVYYNFSSTLPCLNWHDASDAETQEDGDFWGWQYCTEMFMPFAKDGKADMFWEESWDPEAASAACRSQWGVEPRRFWAQQEWGGRDITSASNIVFSNGLLDPWHGGGVLHDLSPTLVALIIPEGAHHLDLMFSNENDPPSVVEVRKQERAWMQRWVKEHELTMSKSKGIRYRGGKSTEE